MKYVQINAFAHSWAKHIVLGKHNELLSQGHDSYVFWGYGEKSRGEREQRIISNVEWQFNNKVKTRLDGKSGFHSKGATKRLLRRLDEIHPDVVHLHSLCGDYINLELLFSWLEKSTCQVIWTLHDCWSFTGFCLHFTGTGCLQWQASCGNACPASNGRKLLPMRTKSNVAWSFEKKKDLFTKLPESRLIVRTPSQWLAGLVGASFLNRYRITVVNNDIDRTVFRPTESSFRSEHGLEGKTIILGVANPFSEKKGFDDFVRLSKDLDDAFAIVMVGVNGTQVKKMGEASDIAIVCLPATEHVEELVDIYSASDLFFNPTREDNYPTVNLEAEACGTPVITYDVGGCRETLSLRESVAVSGYEEALDAMRKVIIEHGLDG